MAASLVFKRINSFFRRIHTKTTLISKKIIKPLSPTPKSLNCYNLSSSDQALPDIYIPFSFFYPSVIPRFQRSQISQHIKNGLSKTLTSYYPFAGRLVGNDHISCKDAGVDFQEVKINSTMFEILNHSQEDIVFPNGLQWRCAKNPGDDSLVVVQLNYFDCGGVAISACGSHKLVDGSTMGTFVNDFAIASHQSDYKPSPQFIASTIFPPVKNPISFPYSQLANVVSKRFIIPADKIVKLKNMAADLGIEKPTRVEVVTALLYRHACAASSKLDSGSVLHQPMNLRPLIGYPVIGNNSVGNIWAMNVLVTEDNGMSFPELVSELRNAKVTLQNIYKQKLNSSSPMQDKLREILNLVSSERSFDLYHCTSICRFPFYEVDFGWGKPIRVSIGRYPYKDTFFLIDTPGDGIEALVSLEGKKMAKFENDKEFISFASLYP